MQVVHLRQLHEQYGDRAQFLFVYIHEGPHDFPMSAPESADAPPDSRSALVQRVGAGIRRFDLYIPCLLDNEQREVESLYHAYPLRMLVVDPAGCIVVDSGAAPWNPFPWKATTDWLDHYVATRG
jgi:hypothetical protein